MPYFVMETLSKFKGLPGLFVSCVFSGSLRFEFCLNNTNIEKIFTSSTLSSGFNALATVTWDDLLKRYFRNIKEKNQLLVTKLIGEYCLMIYQ